MGVVLWVPGPDDAEAQGAVRWAREQGIRVASGDLQPPPEGDVLWIHAGSAMPMLDGESAGRVAQWIERGGVLACTLLATPLAQALGAPGPAPRQVPPMPWSHADDPRWPEAFHAWPEYPHLRGCQGYGAHPLYRGLVNGTFSWMAREGDLVGRCEYLQPEWPDGEGCAVIGVDRSYVHLDAGIAVAWEYLVGQGNIRCVGAHLCFTSGDPILHSQRDALLRNLLAPDWSEDARAAWPASRRHARVTVIPAPRPLAATEHAPGAVPSRRAPAGDAPVTLGTPTGLMTGTERGGVTELWLHPLCIIDEGIRHSSSGGELRAASCEVSGAHFERVLEDTDGARWRERVIGGVDAAAWWYELSPLDEGVSASIGVEFSLPLRLAWPMPATALHPLRTEVRRDGEQANVLLTGADGRHRVLVGIDGAAELLVEPTDVAPRVRILGAPGKGVRIAIRAAAGDRAPVVAGDLGPSLLVAQRARWADIDRRTPRLQGTEHLSVPFSWARTRLANFLTSSLSGHAGMTAGFAPTRAGWNRSRPGYAWFFGRDTCWCVDALLLLGLFDEARRAIQLLVDTMDVTGKVAHEVSTSGVAHYDAADSTPLLLRAIAMYAEWTGDTGTCLSWWPAVKRALAYVASTDRDGDGLPGNTLVGHGWIEMGPHGGGAVTSYMAACWADALRRLSSLGSRYDDGAVAREAQSRFAHAVRGLDGLRLPDGRLALHGDSEGRLEHELTALAAIPVALGIESPEHARATMRILAEPRYQTPWGLRMLPADSPRYAPRAYHGGAVWPLFTGWAALADAWVGEGERALERVQSIARLTALHNVGAFDEVLDGDTGTPAGVCSDQAWSAAAMITPLMRGVLGIEARKAGRVSAINVRVPVSLDGLSLRGLRTGETRWSAAWSRDRGNTVVELQHDEGPSLAIEPRDAAPFVLAAGECTTISAGGAN